MYATPIQKGLYEDATPHGRRMAYKLLKVLRETISPKVHRATIKSLKGTGFPDKVEFVISVPLTTLQRELYDKYVDKVVENQHGPNALWAILKNLGLICSHPRCLDQKMKTILKQEGGISDVVLPETQEPELEDVLDMARSGQSTALSLTNAIIKELRALTLRMKDLDAATLSWRVQHLIRILDVCKELGEKVLIFSHNLATLDYLEELFRQQRRLVFRLDGHTRMNSRTEDVRRFNEGTGQAYLISTTAGGMGLNIHGANRIVIMDFWFNPMQEQQAIGRAYRIGQQRKVYVYQFIAAGTYQDELHERAVFKRQLADRVVDQRNPRPRGQPDGAWIHHVDPGPATSVEQFKGTDTILDAILGDRQLRRGVHSIVMTDTFEEEDPEAQNLTAEENQEVQFIVDREKMRHKDPIEFDRLQRHDPLGYSPIPSQPFDVSGLFSTPSQNNGPLRYPVTGAAYSAPQHPAGNFQVNPFRTTAFKAMRLLTKPIGRDSRAASSSGGQVCDGFVDHVQQLRPRFTRCDDSAEG
jgi:superfamily II DNA or RNA helicase